MNHGIRALPNLETKIVAANTLISLPDFSSEDLFLKQFTQPIEKKIEEAYHRYFSVQNRQKKLKIQNELKALRGQLGEEILQNIGAQESSSITEKARSIAKWDPFDAQASSDFFDARWMFGESLQGGFNIVIGNPPYVALQKIKDDKLKKIYKNNYKVFTGNTDLYCLFIELGSSILSKQGSLGFITSNKWIKTGYGKTLREYVLDNTEIIKLIDLKSLKIFKKADVDTSIIFFKKGNSSNLKFVNIDESKFNENVEYSFSNVTNIDLDKLYEGHCHFPQYNAIEMESKNRWLEILCVLFGHEWGSYRKVTSNTGRILEESSKCSRCRLENFDRSGYLTPDSSK